MSSAIDGQRPPTACDGLDGSCWGWSCAWRSCCWSRAWCSSRWRRSCPASRHSRSGAAVLVAAAMALINALLWPIVTRLALPLTILTFGLGSLVLSAGTVALAFYVVDGKSPPFWRRPGDRVRTGARVDARRATARRGRGRPAICAWSGGGCGARAGTTTPTSRG